MEIHWKDVTSHSRGAENRETRTVEAQMGQGGRLVVTRLHGVDDMWFTHLHGVDFKEVELQAKGLDAAKEEAVERLKHRLRYLLQYLEGDDEKAIDGG